MRNLWKMSGDAGLARQNTALRLRLRRRRKVEKTRLPNPLCRQVRISLGRMQPSRPPKRRHMQVEHAQ